MNFASRRARRSRSNGVGGTSGPSCPGGGAGLAHRARGVSPSGTQPRLGCCQRVPLWTTTSPRLLTKVGAQESRCVQSPSPMSYNDRFQYPHPDEPRSRFGSLRRLWRPCPQQAARLAAIAQRWPIIVLKPQASGNHGINNRKKLREKSASRRASSSMSRNRGPRSSSRVSYKSLAEHRRQSECPLPCANSRWVDRSSPSLGKPVNAWECAPLLPLDWQQSAHGMPPPRYIDAYGYIDTSIH